VKTKYVNRGLDIKQLSEKHRAILKAIVTLFHERFNGPENIAQSPAIVEVLRSQGHRINDASFRGYLGIIRRHDSCTKYLKKYHGIIQHAFIVSNNEGYFWTEDLEEMKAFWKSQHGRVKEIMTNVKPLYKMMGWTEEQLKAFSDDQNDAA
jgi:hypothetical protein